MAKMTNPMTGPNLLAMSKNPVKATASPVKGASPVKAPAKRKFPMIGKK